MQALVEDRNELQDVYLMHPTLQNHNFHSERRWVMADILGVGWVEDCQPIACQMFCLYHVASKTCNLTLQILQFVILPGLSLHIPHIDFPPCRQTSAIRLQRYTLFS